MVLLSWQLAFKMTWTKACATKIIGPSKHCILTSHVVQMFRRCFFFCAAATGRNASLCMTVRFLPCRPVSGEKGSCLWFWLSWETWPGTMYRWYDMDTWQTSCFFVCWFLLNGLLAYGRKLWSLLMSFFETGDGKQYLVSSHLLEGAPNCTTACLIQKTTRHLQEETLHGF